jgi:hypothetical protein
MSDVKTLQRKFLETFLAYERLGETRLSLSTLSDAAQVNVDRSARDAVAGLLEGELLDRDDENRLQLTAAGRQRAVWFEEWFAPRAVRPMAAG